MTIRSTAAARDGYAGLPRTGKAIRFSPDRISVTHLWPIFGRRNRCQVCEERIGALDLDFEVHTGQEVLHFHRSCHAMWAKQPVAL